MNLAHTFVQNSKYCRTTKQNRTEEELNLSCPLLLFVCSDSQKLYMLWFLSPFISPFGLPSILLSYSPSLYTPLFVLSNLHLPRSPFITSDQRRGNFDAWASSQTQKGIFSPDHSEADASSWCEVCNFLPRSFFLWYLQPPSPSDSRLRQWIMMSGRSWLICGGHTDGLLTRLLIIIKTQPWEYLKNSPHSFLSLQISPHHPPSHANGSVSLPLACTF